MLLQLKFIEFVVGLITLPFLTVKPSFLPFRGAPFKAAHCDRSFHQTYHGIRGAEAGAVVAVLPGSPPLPVPKIRHFGRHPGGVGLRKTRCYKPTRASRSHLFAEIFIII